MDFFCSTVNGIRVGYPSPALLRTLSAKQRTRVRGRAIIALTANHAYALNGVHPGAKLAAVARRLKVGRPFQIGSNSWYLAPAGASRSRSRRSVAPSGRSPGWSAGCASTGTGVLLSERGA